MPEKLQFTDLTLFKEIATLGIEKKSSHRRCFYFKKECSKTFHKICWKTPVTVCFSRKETPVQMFCCEFYEMFKNAFIQNTSGQLLLKMPIRGALNTLSNYQTFCGNSKRFSAVTYLFLEYMFHHICPTGSLIQKQPPEGFCKKRCF